MQMMPKHIFWSTIDSSSFMLPELHAFKVLFYAESVSVVASGHVTGSDDRQFRVFLR